MYPSSADIGMLIDGFVLYDAIKIPDRTHLAH